MLNAELQWITTHSLIAWSFRQECVRVEQTIYQPYESGRFGGVAPEREAIAARVMAVINKLPHASRSMIWCAFTGRVTDQMAIAASLPDDIDTRDNGYAQRVPLPLALRRAIVREWLGGETISARKSAVMFPGHSHMLVQRIKVRLIGELDRALTHAIVAAQSPVADLVRSKTEVAELI